MIFDILREKMIYRHLISAPLLPELCKLRFARTARVRVGGGRGQPSET